MRALCGFVGQHKRLAILRTPDLFRLPALFVCQQSPAFEDLSGLPVDRHHAQAATLLVAEAVGHIDRLGGPCCQRLEEEQQANEQQVLRRIAVSFPCVRGLVESCCMNRWAVGPNSVTLNRFPGQRPRCYTQVGITLVRGQQVPSPLPCCRHTVGQAVTVFLATWWGRGQGEGARRVPGFSCLPKLSADLCITTRPTPWEASTIQRAVASGFMLRHQSARVQLFQRGRIRKTADTISSPTQTG